MTERARYWADQLAGWKRSGLSQAEFCRQKGIKPWTFNWWKRQLLARQQSKGGKRSSSPRRRSSKLPSKQARGSANSFVEVKMTDGALSTGYEVVLSNGRVIRLGQAFNAEAVTRLIAAVEGAC